MRQQSRTLRVMDPIRTRSEPQRSKYKDSGCDTGFHVWTAETQIGDKCKCGRKVFGTNILSRGFIEMKRK